MPIKKVRVISKEGEFLFEMDSKGAERIQRQVYAKGCEYVGGFVGPKTLYEWKQFVWEFFPFCKVSA